MAPERVAPPKDYRPPLGSWRRLYALVLFALVVEIALFGLLSRAFP